MTFNIWSDKFKAALKEEGSPKRVSMVNPPQTNPTSRLFKNQMNEKRQNLNSAQSFEET